MRFNTKQISSGSFLGTFTGSLQGTASWANNALTASYFSGSITNAQTASYVVSSSYALTASYVENAITNKIATGSITASVNNDLVIFSLVSESVSFFEIDQNGSINHGAANIIGGIGSHVEGNANITIGDYSHAEGQATIAIGTASHAEGVGTQSPGTGSHTEGLGTITYGDYQHAEGRYNKRFNTSSILIIGNGTDDSNRSDLALFNSESIIFSSSLEVTNGITGSLQGTASYALFALTLSGSTNSSSYAQTASYVVLAQSASYVLNAISSSYSAFASSSATSSYVEVAQSSSYSLSIKGGLQNYIPLWATNNVLTSSLIYQSGSSICISSSNGLKFGVTQNDFVNGFASNLPASVQINHGGSDYGLAITRYTNDASAANFTFYRTRGGSSSVKGALSDGTRIGAINILGVAADGTTTSVGGGFTWYGIPTNTGEAYGTGTPASSSMPILLDYRTVGFANTSEYIRMRLYPNGEFVFADSTGVIGLVKGVKMQIRGKALVENSLKIGAFEEASASFALDVTGSSKFIGDIQVTGSLYAPFITGSLEGTASYAITASYFSGSVSNAISASFAQTASYALNANSITSQISLGSVTASVNTDTSSFSVISGSTILFKINSSGSLNHGDNSSINGLYSHAEGFRVTASGDYSHAEGAVNIAFGNWSHVEGTANISSGSYSHAEGFNTRAVGTTSHTEGTVTISNGAYSHAEGNTTIAEGLASHAEGNGTIASGSHSHAEGIQTTARGDYSHAEGVQTISIGTYSHAEGLGTIASGSFQHAQGKYNTHNNTSSLMIIGNGVNASNRSDLALFNSESIVFNKPVTGSVFSGSFIGSITSASYSTTSSLPLLGIITASASNTTITFTKGDGTTFNVTVSQSGSVATASYALFAENANTASYVLNAVSSSFAQTASYYGGSVVSASYALSSSQSQNANTASYVQLAQSASYATTASYALNAGILFTSSLATAATSSVIIAITTASYTAGFFDYTVYSGSNARAGTIMSVWNNISTEYTDNSTNDIGLTSDISFLVDLSGSLVRLRAITLVSQWNVKVTYRLI